MTDDHLYDPKGLIKDAFAIEGIAAPECRSIFLDWALGLPPGRDVQQDVKHLIAHYAGQAPASHPMWDTLNAALQDAGPPRRRGGRQGRQ
ncbi:hypothetical protein [Roseobacter sp. CCS2]|uniref:hypothetical protein n=1 Tax=Roseobacter sp. CCS2 TaxID=391593 RepID=UPI0000F405A3|nr:hypothetical protein [Roseobacter sp. CCS2]EBA11323.1 hypothetical protein RCCS2_01653 [Roseobacter sp. CCS2]